MTTFHSRSHITMLIIATIALSVVTFPVLTFAATYAYVNTAGEVRSVVANDPMTAIAIAPSRAVHSGVILLSSQADNDLIGNNVSGY